MATVEASTDRPDPVRIVHLSDVHLSPLPPFPWRHWNLKRLLGYLNWKSKRQFVHTRDAVDTLVDHIHSRPRDHILVGGDLCNIGLPLEYARALNWLLSVGTASEVACVPGNHDIYCRLLTDPGIARWEAYLTGDTAWTLAEERAALGPTFPYVRVLNNRVAIIGINTAIPTAPGNASGRIGKRQLSRLSRVLTDADNRGLFRLVLMHHPPRPDQALPSRGLRDAPELMELIAEVGAELIVHGHNHRAMKATAVTPRGPCPIIGVPSASAETAFHDWGIAAYHAFDISGDGPGDWHVACNRFGLSSPSALGSLLEGGSAEDDELVELQASWVVRPGAASDIAEIVE